MFKQFLVAASVLASSATAFAHITIANGPVQTGKSAKITFNISHGCNNSTEDTYKIRVDIPPGAFSNIRPMRSDFGAAVLIKDNNVVTAIEWTKPDAEKLPSDSAFYELVFRASVTSPAYTTLRLNITQTCVNSVGTPTTPVVWDDLNAADPEPAPKLYVVQSRANATGWAKFTIPASITVPAANYGVYFSDALIVWKGTSAFSANANTRTQILATSGTTELTADLAAGDEIWVRY